jgi:hypothetical protein
MSIAKVSSGKTNSLLSQQLDQSKGSDKTLQAWFQLKPESDPSSSQDVASTANRVIDRVKDQIGKSADSVKLLPNLSSFMVSAHPDFIRELIKQPEISLARSTDVPDFGLIRPVKSEPVRLQRQVQKKRSRKTSR